MANPWPQYTFLINTVVLNKYSWSQPNRTSLDGNETLTEESNIPNTMTTWLASLFPGTNNIDHRNGKQITAYGQQALYLNKTYCSNPPNLLADPLVLINANGVAITTGKLPS